MLSFIVYGNPAPQGSKRYVGTTKTGRGIMIESSKKVRPWRMDVKAAAEQLREQHACQMPLDGPLIVSMVFTLPKPASAPKKRRTWADKKPDLSKLARSTEDAISDAGVWRDDARIVEYRRLAKVFAGEDQDALSSTGVRVTIWRADQLELPLPDPHPARQVEIAE